VRLEDAEKKRLTKTSIMRTEDRMAGPTRIRLEKPNFYQGVQIVDQTDLTRLSADPTLLVSGEDGVLTRASHPDRIDILMRKAIRARTSKEANTVIDELGKYGDDPVNALEEVVDQTKFEEVRAHGLQVIRDIKFEETQF